MMISTKYTHADLLAMPDDGKRREIIDGELYVTPSPISQHQIILQRLNRALDRYLETHPIGVVLFAPLDVILSEYDVVEPDLLLVLNEHRSVLQDWVRGAPDLVVEVLSPGTAARDRGVKLKAYARYGIREYWIADPEQKAIEVCRHGGPAEPQATSPVPCPAGKRRHSAGYQLARIFSGAATLTSPLLTGFALPVAAIFRVE